MTEKPEKTEAAPRVPEPGLVAVKTTTIELKGKGRPTIADLANALDVLRYEDETRDAVLIAATTGRSDAARPSWTLTFEAKAEA